MKRKPPAVPKPVVAPKIVAPEVVAPEIIAPEIMESAKRSLETDRVKPMAKCIVCGSEATPNPVEQLCWVCRRLKISAWKEVEQAMPAQE